MRYMNIVPFFQGLFKDKSHFVKDLFSTHAQRGYRCYRLLRCPTPRRHGSLGTSNNSNELSQQHHTNKKCSLSLKLCDLLSFQSFLSTKKAVSTKFYLFEEILIRFKDYWGKFKDVVKTLPNFSIFKNFSRPVQSMTNYNHLVTRVPALKKFS